jgi:hypothetical protein
MFMKIPETAGEYAARRAGVPPDRLGRLLKTGRMLVKEMFVDTPLPDAEGGFNMEVYDTVAMYVAPEFTKIGRACARLSARVLTETLGADDTLGFRRILALNQAAIDQSVAVVRYDANGVVTE